MASVTENQQVENFKLMSVDGPVQLADFIGQKVVIFFYPKDDTPGCTREAKEFSQKLNEFDAHNAVVLGVSRDSVASHQKFIEKYDLNITLLADPEETVCEQFGVMVDKNLYGKMVRGIERSTFIVNESGELVKSWRRVKVEGHVAEVLGFL